jgi:hypothetical protein
MNCGSIIKAEKVGSWMKMGLMWIVKFGMICRSWKLRVEEDSSL